MENIKGDEMIDLINRLKEIGWEYESGGIWTNMGWDRAIWFVKEEDQHLKVFPGVGAFCTKDIEDGYDVGYVDFDTIKVLAEWKERWKKLWKY